MHDGSNMPWMTLADLPNYFVSYAQSFEDVILARVFTGEDGFYIDVGANDPLHNSVTRHFYNKGWSGVNVEPHLLFHHRLVIERTRDVNLNVGMLDRETAIPFHEETSGHGISSIITMYEHWNHGRQVQVREIKTMTLAQVCERHAHRPIDFLKIDVEGVERMVCEGGDWAKYRPRVVLIEASFPEYFQDWDDWFLRRDFHFALFDGLNRFYVRAEDRDLIPILSVPFSSLDRAISYDQVQLIEKLVRETEDLRRQLEAAKEATPAGMMISLKRQLTHQFPLSTSAMKQLLGRAG